MTETTPPVRLSGDELSALACRCHAAICPLHNEASDGYIEHRTDDLIAAVERILSDRLTTAEAALTEERKRAEVGRCGDRPPVIYPACATAVCRLPHGHDGWHRGDNGSEWSYDTPAPEQPADPEAGR